MQTINSWLSELVSYAWGMPLVVLLVGGGSYLLIRGRFLPLTGFFHSFKLVLGKVKHDQHGDVEGQISHFKALTNALSATIGLGNISGVAIAIHRGGAGAIFWMWVAALIGMNTKFFECTLSLMFRGKDSSGEVQGGPMYTIEKGLPKAFRPFAVFFALCGLIGTMALFQSNQLAVFMVDTYGIPPIGVGIVSAALVAFILLGGIQRLAKATSSLVPTMCVLYVVCCLLIVFLNYDKVPAVFISIFREAFTGKAATGAAIGLTFSQVLIIGIKRAAFSNEAGIGTAPMAHGNAKTNEPIAEGLVAMIGPFIDTIIVCTLTAVVILLNDTGMDHEELSGILLTASSFEHFLPGFGRHFLGIAVLLFSFTTMLGSANYNQKCWDYVFKGRGFTGGKMFTLFYSGTILLGSIVTMGMVVNLIDLAYAFMSIPNMTATLILAPKVTEASRVYFAKYVK